MNTQPAELFTPAEREAAEAFIFSRLAQLGAPADVIAATQAHLNNMEVAEAANARLKSAAPRLYEAWDDLHPLDLQTTPRADLDAFIALAKDEPAAAYQIGFVQALMLVRIDLQAVTGRDF